MKKITIAALAAVAALSAAPALADVNATGTYLIDVTCKGYDEAGKFSTKTEGSTLQITQSVNDLNVVIVGAISNGRIMIEADHPDTKAAASFVSCTVNNDLDFTGLNYNYLGQINFSASDTAIKVKGSYYSGAAIGDQFSQYCKFKGERTSATNPLVASCPP